MSHSPRRKLMLGGEKFGNFSHSQIFGITSTCLFVLTIYECAKTGATADVAIKFETDEMAC